MLIDPIANLLTSIRNALQVRKETVDVPASKLGGKILQIFKEDGYIEDYRLVKDNVQGTFKIYLKYEHNRKSVISGLRRVSRPGLRSYYKAAKMPRIHRGLGTAVVSTSKGVMRESEARKLRVGGEILCYVW